MGVLTVKRALVCQELLYVSFACLLVVVVVAVVVVVVVGSTFSCHPKKLTF